MTFRGRSTCVALALLALAHGAAGCGKISTDNSNNLPARNLADAQRIALLTQVSCFSQSDCDPSVAMIAAAWLDQGGVSTCTGFLVGPDTMATNSHCLPLDLDQAGAS